MDVYLHPLSPFRPPHWRWNLSKDCINGPVVYWHYVDEPIWEAAAYRWRKLQGEDVSADPIAIAYDIRKEDSARRAELEARLLARETPEIIAGKMGMSGDVVEQYALLFFDLPPEGYGNDWFLLKVFHSPCSHLRQVTEFENWRWLGWTGGPFVLEVALRDYHSGEETELGTLLRGAMQLACEIADSAPFSPWFWEAAEREVKSLRRRKDPGWKQLRRQLRLLRLSTQPPPTQRKTKEKAKVKQAVVAAAESTVAPETTQQPLENTLHDYIQTHAVRS